MGGGASRGGVQDDTRRGYWSFLCSRRLALMNMSRGQSLERISRLASMFDKKQSR